MVGKWDLVKFQLFHTTVVRTTTARLTAWCYTSWSFENRHWQIEAIKNGCSNILQNLTIPSANISRIRTYEFSKPHILEVWAIDRKNHFSINAKNIEPRDYGCAHWEASLPLFLTKLQEMGSPFSEAAIQIL